MDLVFKELKEKGDDRDGGDGGVEEQSESDQRGEREMGFTTSERTIRWAACCQKVPLLVRLVLVVEVVAVVEVSAEGLERRGRGGKRGQEPGRFEREQGS